MISRRSFISAAFGAVAAGVAVGKGTAEAGDVDPGDCLEPPHPWDTPEGQALVKRCAEALRESSRQAEMATMRIERLHEVMQEIDMDKLDRLLLERVRDTEPIRRALK